MAYYVYSVKRGRFVEPHGPYNARAARTYARIAASRGRHNRAVTRGPRGRVTRMYQRGTGRTLHVGDVGTLDPSLALFFLTALHTERRVPPGYQRKIPNRKGLHDEPATLFTYASKDVYVLPDAPELSGYRVPGGSKDLDVSGALQAPFWLIVDLSNDGRTWKRVYNAPATGDEAGSFMSISPAPRPFIRETWYKRTAGGWRKQGSVDNWS